MDCRDVRALLPGYQDERLAQDDRALVQAHLTSCTPCTGELGAGQQTDAVIRAALSDHPFGDEAVERLLGALPIREAAQRAAGQRVSGRMVPHRGRPGLSVGVAAAAALLLAGGLLLAPGREGPAPTVAEASAPVVGRGTGLLRRTAEGGFETLPAGAALRAGETLVAVGDAGGADEAPAWIELDDGTHVDLHADTELSLEPDPDGGLTVAMGPAGGEVFCQVARRQAPFRVRARNLDVEVMGTRFLVHQGSRVSRVVVHQGAVLASAHGQRRKLGPDDAAESRPDVEGLECLRVTALQHGLWVPRLREEARAAALAQQHQPQPPAVNAAPVDTRTPGTAPAIDPGLDVPVVPPTTPEQEPKLPGQDH